MLFSILQDGISGVTDLYLKGKLKEWWNYHKIDRQIAREIRDTCDDEGFNFDELLNRLGTSEASIKERSKQLKKAFKEKKTVTGTEDFIEEVVDSYLDILLDVEDREIQSNPLNSEELGLIERIKTNIHVYLTNFKPVETIASIKINLKKVEKQSWENYQNLMSELNYISSQSELVPENLNNFRRELESKIDSLGEGQKLIIEKLEEGFSKDGKIARSISYSELFDIKLGFVEAKIISEKDIKVGSKYKINIYTESRVPLQVIKVGVNVDPVEALIFGKIMSPDSQQDGYYAFSFPEMVSCNIGKSNIASLTLNGPKPNFRYELYVMLEGQVEQNAKVYPFKRFKGPLTINRENELEVIGNIAMSLIDKFIGTDLSKTIKKFQEEGEEKLI